MEPLISIILTNYVCNLIKHTKSLCLGDEIKTFHAFKNPNGFIAAIW
jgi:hypothetical protein